MPTPIDTNCYDFPQYWDLAFRSETELEANFLEPCFAKFSDAPVKRLLEPGCGGGRLVVEMAARNYEVTGYDLSETAVRYVRRRLRRRGLRADVHVGDMADFVAPIPVDAAFNTMNTFRHLLTEDEARSHLRAVAASVREGGLYVLGLHLLPLDADEEDGERWTAQHASTKVTVTLRVVEFDRRSRIETLRFNLLVRRGSQSPLRLRSDYRMRIYTADQFRELLAASPQWELLEVYDFWYDLSFPRKFDDDLGDAVFVLRRTRRPN